MQSFIERGPCPCGHKVTYRVPAFTSTSKAGRRRKRYGKTGPPAKTIFIDLSWKPHRCFSGLLQPKQILRNVVFQLNTFPPNPQIYLYVDILVRKRVRMDIGQVTRSLCYSYRETGNTIIQFSLAQLHTFIFYPDRKSSSDSTTVFKTTCISQVLLCNKPPQILMF